MNYKKLTQKADTLSRSWKKRLKRKNHKTERQAYKKLTY
jgi:hypothetical protein